MRTVEEFHQRVINARKRLLISRRRAWFRGHRLTSYKLLPSILRRRDGRRHERNLFANFKTQAARQVGDLRDSWEILAVMQHHGVPTRLLDWTESLHTALFFALEGKVESPCIWILNPYRLNQKAAKKKVVFDQADEIGADYYEDSPPSRWRYDLPIAMDAPWRNERILNQRGSFTFHGNYELPLEESCDDCVKCIPIPPHLVKALRGELARSGFDYFRLFPDLDGLAKSLKVRFKF
jgi:hypothetical protein